ncbi:flagellar hook-length control protein FliK [Sphingomonas qomolangmaensis]|uniref:Flagellar hook-length control protein FliK n=1 Tax=Sphingomonas qomolangmaensis TaxID=2918765 RepID=A0ABY5L5N0_9SPHN|nr:flagellar hook-length control protein FliK [Sphingomonas qomolangmaensis]UUL82258.1 flagellar hook-length control protein FliK [Sphingomonas qomolangmaensis]
MQPTTNLPSSNPLATLLSPAPARAGVLQAPPRDGLLFADALAGVTAGPAPIAVPPLPPLAAPGKTLPVAAVAAVAATALPVAETIARSNPPQAPLDEPVPTEPAAASLFAGQMPKATPIVERPAARRQPARHPAPEPEAQQKADAAVSAGVPLPLASPALVAAEAIPPTVVTKPDPMARDASTATPLADTGALPPMALPLVAAPADGVASLPPSLPEAVLDHPEALTPASIAVRADHAAPALIAPPVGVPVIAGGRRSPTAPTADRVAPATPHRHMVQAALAQPDPPEAPVFAAPDRSLVEGRLDAPAGETPNHHPAIAEAAALTIAEQPTTISPLAAPQVGERPSVPSTTNGDRADAAPTTILGNAPLPTIVASVPADIAQPRQPAMVPPALQVLPRTPEPALPAQDAIAASQSPVVDRAAARTIAESAATLAAAFPAPQPGAVAAPAIGWRSPVLREPIDETASTPTPVDSVDTTQALRARINVAFADAAPTVPPTEAPELDLRAIDPISAATAPPIDRTAAIDAPAVLAPVATNDPAWTAAMIDRIETLRDTAGARETRIRLTPDALGAIEVTIRETTEGLQVQLTADTPAARALLTEAAPRLTEMADARGLKLGQHDSGTGQQGQQGHQRASPEQQRAQPNRSAGGDATDTDERIA